MICCDVLCCAVLTAYSTIIVRTWKIHILVTYHSTLPYPILSLSSPLLCAIRWGEVDFLLRRRIESEEDIEYTTAAAEAGLLFIDQVCALPPSYVL